MPASETARDYSGSGPWTSGFWRTGPTLLLLASAWGLVIRALWADWRYDPQYHYGFLVPLLCLMLFRQRWLERAAPRPATNQGWGWAEGLGLGPVVLMAGVLIFFPANPEWRMLGGISALLAVGLTLLWVWQDGGWPGLRHYGFAIVFFLIAVPWPRMLEQRIMNGLMDFNASAALEIVRLAGYEAYRRGNLIELPTGVLGVEEACSGIRSLQGTLMAALCFGEMFRLGWGRRIGLVVFGVGVALAGNIVRTSALTVAASSRGLSAVENWHDRAGLFTLVLSTALIWLLATLLARWNRPAPPPVSAAASPRLPVSASPRLPPPAFAPVFALGALLVWAATWAGTEWWFRQHRPAAAERLTWQIRTPEEMDGVTRRPIAPATETMLRYDLGMSGEWTGETGLRCQYFFFIWDRENAAQVTALHDPRACLGAIGMTLEELLEPQLLREKGVALNFRAFRFRDHGRPVHVFQAVTDDGASATAQEATGVELTYQERWEAVKEGRRFQGRRIVEVAIWGTESLEEARAALQTFLDHGMLTASNDRPRRAP